MPIKTITSVIIIGTLLVSIGTWTSEGSTVQEPIWGDLHLDRTGNKPRHCLGTDVRRSIGYFTQEGTNLMKVRAYWLVPKGLLTFLGFFLCNEDFSPC